MTYFGWIHGRPTRGFRADLEAFRATGGQTEKAKAVPVDADLSIPNRHFRNKSAQAKNQIIVKIRAADDPPY